MKNIFAVCLYIYKSDLCEIIEQIPPVKLIYHKLLLTINSKIVKFPLDICKVNFKIHIFLDCLLRALEHCINAWSFLLILPAATEALRRIVNAKKLTHHFAKSKTHFCSNILKVSLPVCLQSAYVPLPTVYAAFSPFLHYKTLCLPVSKPACLPYLRKSLCISALLNSLPAHFSALGKQVCLTERLRTLCISLCISALGPASTFLGLSTCKSVCL
jgi:hypothetical protein